MMKKQLFLTLFLMFLVVVGALTLLTRGEDLWVKDYMESNEFYQQEEAFVTDLMKYVLNPIDFNLAEQNLSVSSEEIDYYRHYYGTLQEQIDNVMAQYEEGSPDAAMDEGALAERDAKIAEIRKNFESDDVVREKILTIKKEALKRYKEEYEREKKQFLSQYRYFSYDLKENKTADAFRQGSMTNLVYSNLFSAQSPLIAPGNYTISLDDYIGDRAGITSEELLIQQTDKEFTGKIAIPQANIAGTEIAMEMKYNAVQFSVVLVLIVLGAVALAILLLVVRPSLLNFTDVLGRVEEAFHKWPIDVRLAIVMAFGFLMLFEIDNMSFIVDRIIHLFADDYVGYGSTISDILFRFTYSFIVFSVLIVAGIWTWLALQTDKDLLEQSFVKRFWQALCDAFLERSIGKQMTVMLIILFATSFTLALAFVESVFALFFLLLLFFAFIPTLYVFIRRFGYLSRIIKQTRDMAEGRASTPIKVKGKSPLAEHARNLNAMREGVERSIREQAKSERLKTELITNVSHDLRTPLTSIITYTDLLKNPDLSPEEREKYVNIVDQKSARLKTLIEDLFEVSKMASGNIEIQKSQIDLALMLQQIAAEHEEDYAKQGLDLRVTIEDRPILAYADGQKWWRVYDNLLVNARKYSMPNTRVYMTLKASAGQAVFTIKNIANYELNESAEELVERFKRADESRHTEGSGLGLAIAQSIVDLHGGQLKIEVDGDLFKVTVLLPL